MARVALLLAVLSLSAVPSHARDVSGPGGPTPEKNFSNIHADVDWVVKAFNDAEEAAAREDWGVAVRGLQTVIDATRSREAPEDAAPYVRAVWGTTVYEGAWIVARHTIAAWGTAALEAYKLEFDATARALLVKARAAQDEAALADIASRYLGLPAGRRAALLLADLALERDDADGALQWVHALQDLETVSAESKEQLAPWRAARITRHAHALARDATAVPTVREALEAAGPNSGPDADIVPAAAMRLPAAPTTWLTTGGNASRSALPAALGSRFVLRWFKKPDAEDDLVDSLDPRHGRRDRPSVWLPPRAVATEEYVFVSDGQYLHVYDIENGRRLFERIEVAYPRARFGGIGQDTHEDRRQRFGFLEGHTLTLHPVEDGHLVLAAVPDGNPFLPRRRRPDPAATKRDDHIQAFHWNGKVLQPIWQAGGYLGKKTGTGLLPDTRLYGAPIVYRGLVWVAGVRPAKATTDRWEGWVFGLDPRTGRAVTRTHVGTGTPVRTGRFDEVIPASVAASRGRVVVATALGILAAIDASDGRIQWIYRYNRAVETERGRRRNRDSMDEGLRLTSFANEPPVLTMDRCYVTPTDGNELLMLFDRPRGTHRTMDCCDNPDRLMTASDFLVEHIAGIAPGKGKEPPRLVLVGKGESSDPPGPIVVALEAKRREVKWPLRKERTTRPGVWKELPKLVKLWEEHSVDGFGPDPYGRALVTAGEVFVPTYYGIAIYELFDRDRNGTHYVGILNTKDIPAKLREIAPEAPFGNLIPIPGKGILAVSATTIAYWERRR